jgi:NADH-quinone oxidoreductase subunit F
MATQIEPIVTARLDDPEAHTLSGYLATGGYEGLRAALRMEPSALVDEVKASNLTGRGGAGFPAGMKWSFLPKGVTPVYLVVNGDESEPGTCKDRPLMEGDPHQLIEGILIASYAIQADRAFLYVRGEMALAQERLATALNDAYAAGYVGQDILGSGYSVDIVLHWGAGAYIVGEETALIESLEGNRGMPRIKPPYFPAAKGLYLQPTVVNNVETLSTLPWVLRNGGATYAQMGGGRSTGTRIYCLSGHVVRPGNYEVEQHVATFRDLIYDPVYGGGIREGRALKAFIPGGASSPWFYEEQLDLRLDADEVGPAGSMLGSGAVIVMDETTCAVRAAWRLVKFFAHESCGKCTPCREGGAWLEKILHRIESGAGRESDLDLLLDVGDNISPGPFPRPPVDGQAGVPFPMKQTTICPLGPSAVSPTYSSIFRFRDEFLTHIKEGGCPHA